MVEVVAKGEEVEEGVEREESLVAEVGTSSQSRFALAILHPFP